MANYQGFDSFYENDLLGYGYESDQEFETQDGSDEVDASGHFVGSLLGFWDSNQVANSPFAVPPPPCPRDLAVLFHTSVPQAWYNTHEGVKRIVTETGAGQWGSALAFACSLFNIDCKVWQVRASYDQKPYRKLMMQTWGAKVHPSPSEFTEARRNILRMDPSSSGSLGIAISEAVEVAVNDPKAKYYLGSVLNHVLLHQTVIGEECIKQMEAYGETPDVIIECTGGDCGKDY